MRWRRVGSQEMDASPQCFFCGSETGDSGETVLVFIFDPKKAHAIAHACHPACVDNARAPNVELGPDDLDTLS